VGIGLRGRPHLPVSYVLIFGKLFFEAQRDHPLRCFDLNFRSNQVTLTRPLSFNQRL
jgi:hypothetical protein